MSKPWTILPTDIDASSYDAILDVRAPAEYTEDHIPGAINAPVLSDAERAQIGTMYKQISPFEARKTGAILTARNIARAVETMFLNYPKNWRPLVYCWRGGQRSGAMQIVLREIGWDALRIEGGYKAWRTEVLKQLSILPVRFRYVVLAGPTGSGKTKILHHLRDQGAQVIDLEQLARHKGSVLGAELGARTQSKKAFDTGLFWSLRRFSPDQPIFIEDEGRRIGDIHLTPDITRMIEQSPVIEIMPDRTARVDFLMRDYAYFFLAPMDVRSRLSGLAPLHPRARMDDWMQMVDQAAWPALIHDLLMHHYDPLYARALKLRAAGRRVMARYTPENLDDMTLAGLAGQILKDVRAHTLAA